MNSAFVIPKIFGQQVFRLNEVESTNKFAFSLLEKGDTTEGTAVLTNYQSAGRGQKGTTWESERDKNLMVSFVIFPDFLLVGDQFLLSKTVSLAVRECIGKITGHKQEVYIKWPNDIIVEDKKIAGILIENVVSENKIKQSVAGIGININQTDFPAGLNAISLRHLTGTEISIESVFAVLCSALDHYYFSLASGKMQHLNENYLSHLYKYNIFADYHYKGNAIRAKIIAVNLQGKLVLATDDNHTIEADLKEISLIREARPVYRQYD